jgi:UDP-GlcNAc:undecaprenyl-phosphate/decaprenyl-phosphate GlcNAc-1-phosphate transferase
MVAALSEVSGSQLSLDSALSPYIYVFYAAFIVAFVFTPVMRSIALYYGIVDQPDKIRKLHGSPVAYLGGVAVLMGWLAGLAISEFVRVPLSEGALGGYLHVKLSIVVGAIVTVSLGFLDDVRSVKPRIKIAGQVFAAAFLLYEGVGRQCAGPLLAPLNVRLVNMLNLPQGSDFFPAWVTPVCSSLLVLVIVVGCCNATNLMDGLDGLCGGVTAIIAGGFLFLAVNLAMRGIGDPNLAALRVVLGLALVGAVLGFVPYNFNPASIFMGDAGSMFLGFACAVMILLLAEQQSKWFLAALVMFALPILDTSLAFARRFVNRRPFFSADRHHFHHQMVARGLSVRRTVVLSYGLTIGFVLLGASIVFIRTRYAGAIYLVVFGSLMVAAYKMGMVHETQASVSRDKLGKMRSVDAFSDLEASNVLAIRETDLVAPEQLQPVHENAKASANGLGVAGGTGIAGSAATSNGATGGLAQMGGAVQHAKTVAPAPAEIL